MFVKNIIATTKKYKFSIHKILFYEIFFILRGFKGNKIGFDINDEFSANIPCPYYFLIKIRKFLDNKQIKSLIDLGCGNGAQAHYIQKSGNLTDNNIFDVTATDIINVLEYDVNNFISNSSHCV